MIKKTVFIVYSNFRKLFPKVYRIELKHYANIVNTTEIYRLKIKELNNIFFSKSSWHLLLLETQ